MNNRIKNKSNKNVHFKSNSNNIKEETKNSLLNTKNNEQVYPTKANLNKKKNVFYNKKPKNNIGINLQKLIINSKKKSIISNNSPQQDQINRNLSFNSVIFQKKNYVKNNSQSILPKTNKQEKIKNKNLKQSYNENSKNNITKGKTYFVRNLDITEVFDNSINSINKFNNNSILINYITPKNQKAKLIAKNNKLIFKNNSFINNNNAILIPGHKIKNCFTNLIINKNDSSNKVKNKAKGIPFSLKKNHQKINSVIESKNNQIEKNDKIERVDTLQNLHSIYKNEIILQKKKISGSKISYKGKFRREVFLTDKNNNNNLKGSFCNNDIINKKIKSAIQKGCNTDKSNQGFENSNDNSLKIMRKLDMDEVSKRDEDHTFIDLKKGKSIRLPNKKFKKNVIINNSKINQNNEKSGIFGKKVIKNESFIKMSSERYNKLKEKIIIRNNLNKNRIIKDNNNDIINDLKIDQKNFNDEDTDTIEDSLKDPRNINDIHVFQTSNISFFNSMKNTYIEFEKIFSLENITEIIINFCDLKTINKLSLLCKKYYQYIKPIILKIIRIKVFNYNKNSNNKYKNKIKTSLFNYSNISSKSNFLLEKKYKDLLFENNNLYDEQIKKDLTRTLPGNKSFQYGNNNYNKLYHLLTAYSNYNKNIGYVQGLNFLAANSIFAFEKEIDEFLFLDALIQKFKLEDFFGVSNNLSIKLEGINNCLNKYIINIKNHLNKLHLNYEFFITGWVLTLFSNSMDNKYLFYVWDYMIIFGWDYFNCFVIAVLKNYENDILSLPLNKLTFYMKNILRNKSFQIEFENIIKTSFDYLLIEKGIKKDKEKII